MAATENTGLKVQRPLSPTEIAAFCNQISMVLGAGISVREGISILYEDAGDDATRDILQIVMDHTELGEPLQHALECTGQFPKYVLDMVQIGEQSGRLDEVMRSLAAYYEREEAIRRSVKSAVTYPLVMIAMMVLVILVLIVKVLPVFSQVFRQLGSEMTGFALGLMRFGQGLSSAAAIIIGVVCAAVLAALILRCTRGGRQLLSRLGQRFLFTKKFSDKVSSGRFASAMSMMLSSGLDTDEALSMVYQLVDNAHTRGQIDECRRLMAEGSSFADALVQVKMFPGMVGRLVSVGFKTGSVDTVMQKVADQYEQEIDDRIQHAIAILEPTLIAVLAVIVGMILISVMLPLMGIMSTIG